MIYETDADLLQSFNYLAYQARHVKKLLKYHETKNRDII